jgi:hypothetical protein
MRTQNIDKRKRPQLTKADKQTASNVYWALVDVSESEYKIDVSASVKRRIVSLIKRLAELAGVEAKGRDADSVFKDALRNAYELERQGEDIKAARRVAERIAAILAPYEAARDKQHAAKREATPEETQETSTFIGDNNHELEPFGLRAGDKIKLTECADPRPGEVLVIWHTKEEKWVGAGRFIKNIEDEDYGHAPHVEMFDDEYTFDPTAHEFYRVTSIKRNITIERPPAEGEASAEGRACERELKRLRERLDVLNENDDITTCSARFKLEKQIYDLEQQGNVSEWPDVIPG